MAERRIRSKGRSIAVMGVSPGMGVTHVCLSVANYLASKEREQVTYVEVASHSSLLSVVGGEWATEDKQCFCRLYGVDYYPAVSVSEAIRLAHGRQGYVVFDITQWDADTPELLRRCCRAALLGSLKPWCREAYGIFIRNKIINNMDKEQMEYFSFCLEHKEKNWFFSHFHVPVHNLPVLSDPFCINRRDFPFLKYFLYR